MDEKQTEKKTVSRKIVKAGTGETVTKPAVVSAEDKKSATGRRWAAFALWILGIVCEVLAILMLNGTLYMPGNIMTWIIAALAVDLVLVIIASLLWKGANRLDPASKKNKLKFFLWNNMGLIAGMIAFVPFIVILLKDKSLDKKSKRILTVIAAIALIIAGAFSFDYDPVSAEDLAAAQQGAVINNGTVYWTQWGRSYHLDPDCHTLSRSSTIYEGSVEEAFEAKRNDPCDFCVPQNDGSALKDAAEDLLEAEEEAE